MENTKDINKVLQSKVETVAGCRMNTPRNFDFLSMRILDKTKSYVSPATLKRYWGYLGEEKRTKPFRFTLDTLARYVGYTDFESFVNEYHSPSPVQSEFLLNDSLQTTSLQEGAKVHSCGTPTVASSYNIREWTCSRLSRASTAS